MTLTWRQAVAYLDLSVEIERIDRRTDLIISAVGAQGDQKALDKMLKELGA